MILIADSGSTKTTWNLIQNDSINTYHSAGLNPYFYTAESLQETIGNALIHQIKVLEVEKVFFFGAGCSNASSISKMRNALLYFFENASITIGDDLLAACMSTAGMHPGVCCILGTGSNSCFYNGTEIAYKIPSLGYILGDEGSGTYIGRRLISSYFYKEMPAYLEKKMLEFHSMDKHEIIEVLYNSDQPSKFLASFTDFCVINKGDEFLDQLIADVFQDFIDRHLSKYPESKQYPIHFIGSVAEGFQNLLKKQLQMNQMEIGKVFKSPFPMLFDQLKQIK